MGGDILLRYTGNYPPEAYLSSFRDILLFFERQPPGFIAYVKLIHLILNDDFPLGIVIGNILMVSSMLIAFYYYIREYIARPWALALTLFMAVGFESTAYSFSTSYEVITAFLVFLLLVTHNKLMKSQKQINLPLAVPPFLALLLGLTRSYYSPFIPIYCGFLLILPILYKSLRKKALVAGTLVCLMFYFGCALKNLAIFDYYGISSWSFMNLQSALHKSLERLDQFDKEDLSEFILQSPDISQKTKRLYTLGMPWPLGRDSISSALDTSTHPPWMKKLTAMYPKKHYKSPLYSSAQLLNGYIFGPAYRHSFDITKAILKNKFFTVIPEILSAGGRLALANSATDFIGAYPADTMSTYPNSAFCWRIAKDYHDRFSASFWRGHDYTWPFGKLAALNLWLQLMVNFYFLPLMIIAAIAYCLFVVIRMISRKSIDSGLALCALIVVYSFVAGTFGEYGENARFNFYWKYPAMGFSFVILAKSAGFSWRKVCVILARYKYKHRNQV